MDSRRQLSLLATVVVAAFIIGVVVGRFSSLQVLPVSLNINFSFPEQTSSVPTLTSTAKPILQSKSLKYGLDGYCPVTLVEDSEWEMGDLKFDAFHQNRKYLFASETKRNQFLAAPEDYTPMLSGYDPIEYFQSGKLIDGKRRHGAFYGSRYGVFTNEENLHKFSREAVSFLERVSDAERDLAGAYFADAAK